MAWIFLFAFGLIIGSFLNVVVYRINDPQKNITTGRSICPHCKHPLSPLDLLPVFSYLLLKGRCRYCKKKISWQYPIVELITGIIFSLFALKFFSIHQQFSLELIFIFFYISVFIIVSAYDYKHLEIPDKIMIPAIVIALLATFLNFSPTLTDGLIGVAIPTTIFGIQYLLSKGRWIGGGDFRIGIFMGLILGYKITILSLYLAYLIGAIIGLFLIIFSKKSSKSQIPFAPFLSIGAIIGIIWGSELISLYLQFIS